MSKLKESINAIELSMVKIKLQDTEEGKGWSQDYANQIEQEYKRFLYLLAVDIDAVPTKDIDAMWHQHILDTRAYAADCQRVFGSFVHHFPYLGMRGPEDKKLLEEKFAATCAAYLIHFGTPYGTDDSCCKYCDSGRCSGAGCIGSCSRRIEEAQL